MVEPTHQCRFIGSGIKPPKGALVKSQGIERLGNGWSRAGQVRIKEMNASEPLSRCREVATSCQKLRSMIRSYEYSGYLSIGYTAGVIQGA